MIDYLYYHRLEGENFWISLIIGVLDIDRTK